MPALDYLSSSSQSSCLFHKTDQNMPYSPLEAADLADSRVPCDPITLVSTVLIPVRLSCMTDQYVSNFPLVRYAPHLSDRCICDRLTSPPTSFALYPAFMSTEHIESSSLVQTMHSKRSTPPRPLWSHHPRGFPHLRRSSAAVSCHGCTTAPADSMHP